MAATAAKSTLGGRRAGLATCPPGRISHDRLAQVRRKRGRERERERERGKEGAGIGRGGTGWRDGRVEMGRTRGGGGVNAGDSGKDDYRKKNIGKQRFRLLIHQCECSSRREKSRLFRIHTFTYIRALRAFSFGFQYQVFIFFLFVPFCFNFCPSSYIIIFIFFRVHLYIDMRL